MSENLWARFETIVTPETVVEAKAKYTSIPEGEYTATLETIEATQSKSGLPMLKATFRTTENKIAFLNKTLQIIGYEDLTARNVAEANDMVNVITGKSEDFTTLSYLAERVGNIVVGESFKIKISYNEKRDPDHNFTIVEVLGKDGATFMEIPDGIDEDLPFN